MSTDSKTSDTNISGHVQADLKQLGKYEIVRKIGAGGMGTVYLAQDKHLNRTVALKVLPRDRAENPILVRRFHSEARASAMLTHDNIVAVFDADQADGYLYIALEYIDGIDLYEWLRKRERIPVKRTIDIIKQVTAALQHAHEKNLVHRDIKPANIMITRTGLVKLADMGLARSVDESLDTTITRDGTTVGTVDYMSPEQAANSKNTDIRSDIYSLGCTWYHMLTGQPPFPEGSLTNKLSAHAKTPPPDPRDFNEGVSDAIVAIIHRMMAKKKEDRYQTPQELLDDINNSSNLESNSGNLLAMLIAEDELEERDAVDQDDPADVAFYASDSNDDSVEFEVQAESQETLLKRKRERPSSTTSTQLPTQNPSSKKQRNPKPKLPPKTSNGATSKEVPRKIPETAESRKPLKRVRSIEELQEVHPTEPTAPVQSHEPANQVESDGSTNNKKKNQPATEKSKPGKSIPVGGRKQNTTQQTSRSQKSKKEQPLQPQKQRKSLGINIDWGRAGLVLLVSGIALAGIWFGLSKFGGGSLDPVQNPYLESTDQQPVQKSSESVEVSLEDNTPDTVDVLVQPVLEKLDEKLKLPRWVVSGWERPVDLKLNTYTVRRGRHRENVFHSLEQALGAADAKTGKIDLSNLTYQALQPQELNISKELNIVAANAQPILSFETSSHSPPASHWLSVKGGALILDGLNVIVTNSRDQVLELIKVTGTDLILRNCTFTSIGENPVNIIGVQGKSALENRIYIENCLFRGENITCVNVERVPCDLYCQNSLMASEKNDLFALQVGTDQVPQKLQFRNCTFVGGETTFALNAGRDLSDEKAVGKIELGVSRSLILGGLKSSTTAVHVSGLSPVSPGSPANLESVSMELQHTKLINIQNLASLKSGEATETTISDAGEWKAIWGMFLPSDDVIREHPLSADMASPSLITAENLESQLQGIAKSGVGERSLLGVEAAQVATVDQNAVERQIVMNRFAFWESQPPSMKWSDKAVRFDLKEGKRLNSFLARDNCPDGTTVVCYGTGLRKISPVKLKNRRLRLQFEQADGATLAIQIESDSASSTMFEVEGGELVLENGPFQIAKSRADQAGTLFLQCSNGANVQVLQSQVSAPMSSLGENQLIACLPNSESGKQSTIELNQTLVSSSRTLLDFNATNQNLIMKNSVLATQGNVLALSGSENSGLVLLDHCTFSQGGAVIDCRGSEQPINVLARDSVFAPSLSPSENSSLLSGSSHQRVPATLTWWELACGHANQLRAPVIISGEPLAGSYENSWNRFWGTHHIYDPLTGTQAVVLINRVEDEKSLKPKDFELQTTGLSASWDSDATGIGAQVKTVGPQLRKQPKPQTQPRTINTPSGF